MHCIVKRETLLRSLQYVMNVLKGRMAFPVLNNILLEIKNSSLYLISTDLEIEMVSVIYLDSPYEAGVTTTSGRKLFDICRALPEQVKVYLNLQGDKLLICAERSSFLISTIVASDFPNLEDWDCKIECIVQKSSLKKLIESTCFAMASQDVRYCLNGMFFEIADKNICAVATDGHRLALSTILVDEVMPCFSVIVPRKGVVEMLRMLGFVENQVKLQIGNHNICLSIENYILTSKLIDSSYPDYRSVFPDNPNNILKVQREVLLQACMRIAILSNEKFHGVRLSLSINQLKITANNSAYEEAEEIIDVKYQSKAMEIGFNVNYLLDVLSIIKGQDVIFFIQDEFSSVKIEDCKNKSNVYIIMPIKL
ncbi:DNA polymerase III subunit beta [Blochmannia endosymbiont of Camponotus (Colobopsis) obliquus]|uniref:DNA polymerase III subunit beta n=1 Tax=Blochmannia endosymbiont of Camponotus (Colobopsis) obliquus TaxID=1505597 RepID=UPI00061A86BA|nr:DNA polymerase III subunit beta [Blochmannia endosymbiont of Camponotus (Colobopsis) obliquus]AKC60200.1 DNA polymerase III subunit beta [Blochmannia endosymbiont of Camponotus (Colobopsis) obliquus]